MDGFYIFNTFSKQGEPKGWIAVNRMHITHVKPVKDSDLCVVHLSSNEQVYAKFASGLTLDNLYLQQPQFHLDEQD